MLRLRRQARRARHAAIAAYAAEAAGTELDLDPDLESAGIEHLLQTGIESKCLPRREGSLQQVLPSGKPDNSEQVGYCGP